MGQVLVAGLITGSIYGIIAIGIVMVYRGSRVLNFAQVELGTFGLYTAWWLVDRWARARGSSAPSSACWWRAD